jgi:hypothetical protein
MMFKVDIREESPLTFIVKHKDYLTKSMQLQVSNFFTSLRGIGSKNYPENIKAITVSELTINGGSFFNGEIKTHLMCK